MFSTIFLIAFLFVTGASHPGISINLPAVRQDKTAAQLASEGMAPYGKKDYALAAKLLQQAIDKGATQSDVFYNAAGAVALSGERDRALQFIEKSIEASQMGKRQ